ncbi:MAG: hypothetical protein NVSMB14_06740 [Isosphaeraceae bacterium]
MTNIKRLRVVRFTKERVPNQYPGGEIPWQVYQGVRNSVVHACRKHGTTGPLGEVRIVEDVDDPYRHALKEPGFWLRGDNDQKYYVIPDQSNHERYLFAELYGADPFNPAWVADVVEALGRHPGWGLGINNIPESSVLLFGDRLMVKGRAFGWWPNANNVVEVVRRRLRDADAP